MSTWQWVIAWTLAACGLFIVVGYWLAFFVHASLTLPKRWQVYAFNNVGELFSSDSYRLRWMGRLTVAQLNHIARSRHRSYRWGLRDLSDTSTSTRKD